MALLDDARKKELAGDLKGAVAMLEAAPEKERTGEWFYARGAMAVRAGDFDVGVKALEEAVRREPEISEYRSNLGAALLEKVKAGDASLAKRALEELELAVQWGAALPDVFANLSFARLANGDKNGALMAADVGIRLDVKHIASHYNRAAALNAMNQLPQCLATLEEILRISPGFAPAVQSKANTLKKMGKA